MKLRHLIVQFLLATAVLISANIGVQILSRNSLPRQLLRRCALAERATDLFLGNSTMASGLDARAFEAGQPDCHALNAALGSTGPVEHCLVYSKQDRHAGAVLYYGFLDTQLTDPAQGDWASLVGNRAMAYYVDLGLAIQFYAPDDAIKALGLRLVSQIPLLRERYAIWANVEKLRRVLGELGMPAKETNRFGRAEDFTLLEPDSENEFANSCGRLAKEKAPLSASVEFIFRRAAKQGVRIYVIEMPMPTSHRKRFYSTPEWARYQEQLKELCDKAGAVYVPADSWVADDGFADALHLNPKGAQVFSRRLANFAREQF